MRSNGLKILILLQNLYFVNIHLYLPSNDCSATCLTNRRDIRTVVVRRGPWSWAYVSRANVRVFWQATNLLGVVLFIHNIPNTLCVSTTHLSATTIPVLGWGGRVRVLVRRGGNGWRHVCGSPTECSNDDIYRIAICKIHTLICSSTALLTSHKDRAKFRSLNRRLLEPEYFLALDLLGSHNLVRLHTRLPLFLRPRNLPPGPAPPACYCHPKVHRRPALSRTDRETRPLHYSHGHILL